MIYRWNITTKPTGVFKYEAALLRSKDGEHFTQLGYSMHADTLWGMKRRINRAIARDQAAIKVSGERKVT